MITAEQILTSNDVKIQKIDVEEWGGAVYVKEFTAAERQAYSAAFENAEDQPSDLILAKIIVASVANEKGELLFSDEHIEALRGKSAVVMEKIVREVLTINGLSQEAVEEASGN